LLLKIAGQPTSRADDAGDHRGSEPARNLMIARFDKVIWLFRARRLLIVICLLVGFTGRLISVGFAAWSDGAGINDASPASIAADSLWASACFWIFSCASPTTTNTPPADADSRQTAAADRVEKLYDGFAIGTDAQGNEGYNAAQKAEEQLLLDFLSSFQNPQKTLPIKPPGIRSKTNS
jgi:hypothetical protein